MSDNVILAQQTIEGFAEAEEGAGVYAAQKEQALSLTEGETYTVAWDGTEYSCIAVSMDGAMALGNLSLTGISSLDSGEPFVIGCVPAAVTGTVDVLMIYTTDAAESHTVAIAVEGIITINRYGEKEYHYGIQTLTLDTTTEKNQRVHTKGVKTEKSVALDMAAGDLIIEPDPSTLLGKVTIKKPETMAPENIRNGVEIGGVTGTFIGDTEETTTPLSMEDGDMVIEPSAEGKVLSKVTIQKPETLIPENIAEGVDIAGIIGKLVAGGANIVHNSGTFTGLTDSAITIDHNLGVIPDIIIIYTSGYTTITTNNVLNCVVGFSKAFAQAIGKVLSTRYMQVKYATVYSGYKTYMLSPSDSKSENACVDNANWTYVSAIYGANEQSFNLHNEAGHAGYVDSSLIYNWFAIGGLT